MNLQRENVIDLIASSQEALIEYAEEVHHLKEELIKEFNRFDSSIEQKHEEVIDQVVKSKDNLIEQVLKNNQLGQKFLKRIDAVTNNVHTASLEIINQLKNSDANFEQRINKLETIKQTSLKTINELKTLILDTGKFEEKIGELDKEISKQGVGIVQLISKNTELIKRGLKNNHETILEFKPYLESIYEKYIASVNNSISQQYEEVLKNSLGYQETLIQELNKIDNLERNFIEEVNIIKDQQGLAEIRLQEYLKELQENVASSVELIQEHKSLSKVLSKGIEEKYTELVGLWNEFDKNLNENFAVIYQDNAFIKDKVTEGFEGTNKLLRFLNNDVEKLKETLDNQQQENSIFRDGLKSEISQELKNISKQVEEGSSQTQREFNKVMSENVGVQHSEINKLQQAFQELSKLFTTTELRIKQRNEDVIDYIDTLSNATIEQVEEIEEFKRDVVKEFNIVSKNIKLQTDEIVDYIGSTGETLTEQVKEINIFKDTLVEEAKNLANVFSETEEAFIKQVEEFQSNISKFIKEHTQEVGKSLDNSTKQVIEEREKLEKAVEQIIEKTKNDVIDVHNKNMRTFQRYIEQHLGQLAEHQRQYTAQIESKQEGIRYKLDNEFSTLNYQVKNQAVQLKTYTTESIKEVETSIKEQVAFESKKMFKFMTGYTLIITLLLIIEWVVRT